MKIGVAMFFTDYSMTPQELAVEAESRGFDSVWSPEHSHIPLSRESAFHSGGDLPKKYYDAMDPFVALMAAAAVTKTIQVGTGVCLVVQRDPIQTAKLVASFYQLSNGRFLFGVGNGWNKDEMRNHGTAFETRHKLARERIEAMKVIWAKSKPEYHGELVDFDPLMTWPKPVQKPHPPIHVGGGWPHGARRAIRYGDGWAPGHGFGDPAVRLPEFRARAGDAGRDAAALEVTVFALPPKATTLARYRDAGADRGVFGLPAAPRDEVLPLLDRCAAAARELAG